MSTPICAIDVDGNIRYYNKFQHEWVKIKLLHDDSVTFVSFKINYKYLLAHDDDGYLWKSDISHGELQLLKVSSFERFLDYDCSNESIIAINTEGKLWVFGIIFDNFKLDFVNTKFSSVSFCGYSVVLIDNNNDIWICYKKCNWMYKKLNNVNPKFSGVCFFVVLIDMNDMIHIKHFNVNSIYGPENELLCCDLDIWKGNDIPKNISFCSVTLFASHALAIDNNGNIWVYGYNYYGQLGFKYAEAKNLTRLNYDVVFTNIKTSLVFTIALDSDGCIWSCGSNEYGQLGYDIGNANESCIFQKMIVPNNINFLDIHCYEYTAVAIDNNGNVWMSGDIIDKNVLTKIDSEVKFNNISGIKKSKPKIKSALF